MAVNGNNYAQVYKKGLEDGFEIVDARQYYVPELDMRPDVEQMMSTPWTCGDRPVFGYTTTNVDLKDERLHGGRDTNTHEFWVYDAEKGMPRNLDDVYPNGYQLKDPNGQTVPMRKAMDQMGDFASAASYYPHVFMAPEFAEARNYLNARMNLPPVTAKDYGAYLGHMENQLQSRDFTFVGKITKISDIHIAYESMEGMEGYEDVMKRSEFAMYEQDDLPSSPYDS